MRFRSLCALGSLASVVSIYLIAQHKYAPGLQNFGVSLAVALIGLAGILALAGLVLGDSRSDKK